MGVSGFFRTIIKKYPFILTPAPNLSIPISYLFIDFNAFIYNTITNFPPNLSFDFSKETEIKKFENKLIELVILDTLNLVNNILKPSKLLYIAVDGVPPLAKMVQQRDRRYKKPTLDKILNSPIKYDTNRVTPGTYLMTQLNKEFTKIIEKKKFGEISVVYDGSNIPGEAEHKYLKLIESIKTNPKENYCIVSEDADVILLTLRFPQKNVFVLKKVPGDKTLENVYKDQLYIYLDCKKFIDALYGDAEKQYGGMSGLLRKFGRNVELNEESEKKAFLVDYVFLTFLEGNDFVKTIYFIKMKEDQMRTPLGIYKFQRKFQTKRLILKKNNTYTINQPFLMAIIKRLADIQDERLKEMKRKIEEKLEKNNKNNKNTSIEHKFYTDKKHTLHKDFMEQFQFLFGDMEKFNQRYYEYFWDNSYNIDEICKSYLDILLFNIRYYFGGGVYWGLNYHALVAPLPSDLYSYMVRNPDYYEKVELEVGRPVDPFVLLAFVMPPQSMSKGVIPEKYKKELLEGYGEYFPEEVTLKLMEPGMKLIYSEPYFKNPTISLLEAELKKVKLTKEEKERNEIGKDPFILL